MKKKNIGYRIFCIFPNGLLLNYLKEVNWSNETHRFEDLFVGKFGSSNGLNVQDPKRLELFVVVVLCQETRVEAV